MDPESEQPPEATFVTTLENITLPAIVNNAAEFATEVAKNPEAWFNYTGHCHNTIVNETTFRLGMTPEDIQSLKNNFQTSIQENSQMRDTLQSISNEKARLEALLANQQQQSSINTYPAKLSEKIPDPPKFSGKKDELRPWMTALTLKFKYNSDRFITPQSDLVYAFTRLEGPALQQVQTYILPNQEIVLANIQALFKILEVAFGDADRRGTAQKELKELYQKDRPFTNYLADFRRIAPDTGFDPIALKSFLVNGLSDENKLSLMSQVIPEDFNDLVALIQRLDSNRKILSALLRTNKKNLAPVRISLNPAALPRVSASLPVSITPAVGGDPMDLSASTFRGPLTAAEKDRRRREGLCAYCGKQGHFVINCPLVPKGPRGKTLQAYAATATPLAIMPADKSENSPSSE